jgi:anti-sigma regulatory factor (Ser/Thr protein kinase)
LARPGAERYARVFAGVAAQVPAARAFTAWALAGCPAGPRDALLLCVTELCANAIEHTASGAGGAFAVEVTRPADGVAYVAVTDAGAIGTPRARSLDACRLGAPPGEEMAEGGRGLALVAAFSSRWGYRGRTAWAEVTWPVLVPLDGIPWWSLAEDVNARSTPGGAA